MAIEDRKTKTHHHVAFAMTHFHGSFRTFNAHSALHRMDQLVEEAEDMAALTRSHPLDHFPATLPQFPGYYLIGFVTCLEWHARSRLADLLSHAPDRTNADDLKLLTEGSKLKEMIALRLTVPEIVGASASVSNLRDYLAVFNRVFDAIMASGGNTHASEAIKARDVPGEPSAWAELERLYETRHELVHEISYQQIGHYNLREPTQIEDAIHLGHLVRGCIQEVEKVITAHAPADFPNLLRADGQPVFETRRLQAEIEASEARLQACAAANPDQNQETDVELSALAPAVVAGRQHVDAEAAWLGKFRPAGWRYHSPADDLFENLLRSRLAYLREVEEALRTYT